MKRISIFLLALVMVISIAGCSADTEKQTDNTLSSSSETVLESTSDTETTYSLGDSVSTDILNFTLERAELAICLHDGTAGDFDEVYLPKEYDATTEDFCIAAKGHTLVSYTYIAENLDRAALEFDYDTSHTEPFISVKYGEEIYDCIAETKAYSYDGFEWDSLMMTCTRLDPAEKMQIRTFVNIPVEVSSLEDDFTLIFRLPSSSGDTQEFNFTITKEDIKAQNEKEISLDDALKYFTKDEGYKYFEKHISEYSTLTEEEIAGILIGEKHLELQGEQFKFSNIVTFDESGFYTYTYKTTEVEIPWNIADDKMIIEMSSGTYECEVKRINDSAYLLVHDNKPFGVLY